MRKSFGVILTACVLTAAIPIGGCLATTAIIVAKKGHDASEKGKASAGMGNPASENCAKSGGTLTISKTPSGGEYGVCTFKDGKACEEWALYRGECPQSGISTAGITSEAGVFCAITGNSFEPDKNICKLRDGNVCPAPDFFDGKCPKKG